MGIPKEFLAKAEMLPLPLRKLLEDEIAAGNEIVEVGHSFPAPPVGAYFKLVATSRIAISFLMTVTQLIIQASLLMLNGSSSYLNHLINSHPLLTWMLFEMHTLQ
jgi:hypothetical protein